MTQRIDNDGYDEAYAPDPATFDLIGWLAGVQPIRKSVTIYGAGHLQARIDELSEHEASLPAPSPEWGLARAELVDLTARLQASALVVTVEARTASWVASRAENLKASGLDDDSVNLALIAEQIVSPPMTAQQLRTLRDAREADVARIMNVAVAANTRPIVLDPRFLRGASG